MAEDSNKTNGDEAAKPKRCWAWWAKALVFIGGFLLVLVATWLTANMVVDRQIAAEFEKYRAAGEPVDIKDFWSPEIPDEENAAIPIRQAGEFLVLALEEEEALRHSLRLSFVCDNPAIVESIILKNSVSVKLIGDARTKNKFSLNLKPMYASNYYHISFGVYRNLARFEILQAMDFAAKGDYALATQNLADVILVTRCLADHRSVTSWLVQIWCELLLVEALEDILPRISKESVKADFLRFMEGLDRLKTIFEDEARVISSGVVGFYHERLYIREVPKILMEYDRLPPLPRYARYPCLPLIKKVALDGIRVVDVQRHAVTAANYPAAEKILLSIAPSSDWIPVNIRNAVADFYGDLLPDYTRTMILFYRSLARRRMAAVAIAMKQYEWETGQQPAKLTDLVPKYLPAVPADPFSATNEPIKLGTWGGRRLLYSIGSNGIDEGGQYAAAPDDEVDWDKYDIPFFLDGDRPRPAPKSAPASLPTTSPTSSPAVSP